MTSHKRISDMEMKGQCSLYTLSTYIELIFLSNVFCHTAVFPEMLEFIDHLQYTHTHAHTQSALRQVFICKTNCQKKRKPPDFRHKILTKRTHVIPAFYTFLKFLTV